MKTVLITGSAHGLGKELAVQFALKGYDIILNDIDVGRVGIFGKYLDGVGVGEVKIVVGDIREQKTINQLCSVAEKMDVDILINNAGVLTSGAFREMESSKIKEMLETNLVAPVMLTKNIYPIFLKKQSGLIININSIAGKNPNSKEAAYCASKYGLRGFFDSFKFESMKHGVNILNVYLGAMNTDMAKERPDREKLINPGEAARVICSACNNFETLKISELNLWRKNY